MEYTILKQERFPNGLILQIIQTEECGGRYYLVINGRINYHSFDLERVEAYYDDIAKAYGPDKGQSR